MANLAGISFEKPLGNHERIMVEGLELLFGQDLCPVLRLLVQVLGSLEGFSCKDSVEFFFLMADCSSEFPFFDSRNWIIYLSGSHDLDLVMMSELRFLGPLWSLGGGILGVRLLILSLSLCSL